MPHSDRRSPSAALAFRAALGLAAAALLPACRPADSAAPPARETARSTAQGTARDTAEGTAQAGDTAAARREIERTVAAYVAATNAGDPEALARLYTDDAVVLPPAQAPVQGRAAIAEFWRQGIDEGLEVTPVRIDVQGDLGWVIGRYNLPATDQDPADSGKTVFCLRRQPDGHWKLSADIWNASTGDADQGDDEAEPRRGVQVS